MTQEIIRTVSCDSQILQYTLEQKPVKNLNLRIRKDCSVYVSANPAVPLQRVDEFVIKKWDYVQSAQKRFIELAEYMPAPKQFVSGESFYILGRELRLKVVQAPKEQICSDGVYLSLFIKDPENFSGKQKKVNRYFDDLCIQIFGKVIDTTYPTFQKYGVPFPKLRIRNMETRWGSCIPRKGIITLNKQLIEAPMDCIEYVVMHEFCHFIHPDHSKRFYALLAMLMPDWKERKSILEKNASYGL